VVRELAALPNVSCKLSGMVTEAGPRWTVAGLRPYAEVVLDAFGPARVMFGSDWPVCLLTASYADVTSAAQELTAALTPEEQALVFGGNRRSCLRPAGCRDMKIPMTHGEIRFSRAPARRGWRGGRYAGCRPDTREW
jgi:L-fuconolactonase